jgi:indole-3-glycerol phosphate synthase
VETPLLRKDFMVHPYQFYEARAHGTDMVLLIAAALSDVELQAFLDLTDALGMTALVETHTEEEVDRAVKAGVEVIGINNRDLTTLEVDLNQFGKLASLIPDDRVKVAESGILSLEDARRLRGEGADAILIGEALVRHDAPQAAVAEFSAVS